MIAPGGNAADERVAVLAIRGDDRVVGLQRVDRAGGHRFLADVQVQEAADLLLAVEVGAPLLEAADAHHVAQQRSASARRSRLRDSSSTALGPPRRLAAGAAASG